MRDNRTAHPLKYTHVLTEDFLKNEYVVLKKSISQLSRELNIHEETITRYLRMHHIRVRSILEQAKTSSKGGQYMYKHILTMEYLANLYSIKLMSINEIATCTGFDRGTIVRYLKLHKIAIRNSREQLCITNPPKSFSLNSDIGCFIDGLLLGDASIPKKRDGTKARSLTQACKYGEYLEYISKRFSHAGMASSPILTRWIADKRCINKGYSQSFLQTHRYVTFESIRERWYPDDKKIIPKDLKITPDVLLQAYLSDGNYYRHILLCTNGFNKGDVLFFKHLIEDILKIAIRFIDGKDGCMLAVKKSDCNKFLEYIGPCPVDCYKYKWKDNESEEARIRKNLNAKISYHRRQNAKKSNLCGSAPLLSERAL